MKLSYLIIFIPLFFISCSDNKIINPEEIKNPVVKIKYVNESHIYDKPQKILKVEYIMTNISNHDLIIEAINWRGQYCISQKVQHFRNSEWITDYEDKADSTIILAPQSEIKSYFWVYLKGEWKTIIPVEDYGEYHSEIITVINESENLIDFNIYQDSRTRNVIVDLTNNSENDITLFFNHHGYCHFSFVYYYLIEDNIYTQLKWDDYNYEWNKNGSFATAICCAEPPKIIIEPGKYFNRIIDDHLPSGLIHAGMRFYYGEDWSDYKVVSKIFEYH